MTPTILTTDILNQIAEGLRIVREGPVNPKPGERIGVCLESATGPLGAPDIRDIPVSSLTGTLPLVVQVPVRVDIEWKVFLTSSDTELKEGPDFDVLPASPNAGDLITAAEVSFLFHPRLVEPKENQIVPGPILAEIRAKVRLTAQPANGGIPVKSTPIELRLPIMLPVIPLPTVLALFRHANFLPRDTNLHTATDFIDTPDGFVLLVVPDDSPLKAVTHLFDVLNTIEELGSVVGSLVPAHARLLLGLQKLAAAISTQPHVKFRAVSQLKNLNAVVMIQRDAIHNDIEVEDEVSSLILIGPNETKVSLFNNRDLVTNDGVLDVETGGAGVVIIRDLHTAGEPVSETGGTVNRVKPSVKRDGFGQAISSLKFVRRSSGGIPHTGLNPTRQVLKGEDVPSKTSVSRGR
jgi:hypothetical protein